MIKLQSLLKESLPAQIPEYPVNIAGHSLILRFDVNVNKTKKGIKLQFVLDQIPQDPRALQDLANEIGAELQEKFGSNNLQVVYDIENPYKNVIGFLIPLPSIANHLMNNVLKGDDMEPEQQGPEGEEAPEVGEELPLRERMKKIAGL